MQVSPIQQSQTSFGAKLSIVGDKNILSEKLITKFQRAAEKIGNESEK